MSPHFPQVILVQVNPGEAFTIRREDGQFQCITGPAQVPMMSPNGSVPPIYVPPGYVSQIIEENGVRRVLVLPQQPEFHPGGHSPLHHPPPPPHAHLPAFIPHPAMMPPPPHMYTGMAGGVGDMSSQYISQYHPRLQKKLKERQGGGGQVKDSPPLSPQKTCCSPPTADIHNGVGGKGPEAELSQAVASPDKQVSDIQARGVVVSWSAPTSPESDSSSAEEECNPPDPINYEVSVSFSGKDGKYKSMYCGEELSATLEDLRPATDYHVRVQAMCNCLRGSPSEAVSFTTLSCEPDSPNPPRKASGTKNTLVLQWKAPCDNGSKIQNYILQWDEGKGTGVYEQCYYGSQKQYRVTKLSPASKYSFRLAPQHNNITSHLWHSCTFLQVAAYNSEGKSNPSQVVEFITNPDRPSFPCKPFIKGRVLPNSFKMTWEPPKDNGGAEVTKYVVELSEGLSWELVYSGPAMEHVCEGLKPGCSYQTRVYCMSEGGQSPLSETLQVQTPAVPPGPCQPPRLVGKPKARELQLRWDGGSPVSCYSVEVSGPQSEESKEVYQGPELDCSVGGLLPGKTYSFRLKAANKAGFGPLSERCDITTGPGAPEQCKTPSTTCKSPSCVVVTWETPPCNGAPVTEFRLEWGAAEGSMQVCYSGPGLSHEMKGLLPSTNYFCRVQAVNVAGVGPFSEAVLCQTPCSVPAAVSNIYTLKESELRSQALPLYSPSTCLGICWEPPCDHGSEITSYLIDLGERQPIVIGPVTKHIIQHLQPDTSYRIRIQALNSLGAGPFSHTFKLKTKPLPPQPPRLECTAFSHQTLRLKWGDGPAKAATSDALQYQLQMGDKSGRFISLYKGPCHTHKVQRLNESTSYMFRIQAFNEAGEGPFSNVYTFTTPRSPPAPVKAPKVERLDDNSCEVVWEALPPMKGDPITYTLQCMLGNSEVKQVLTYKCSSTSFHVQNLQPNSDYRFRVCAIRQCQDAPELSGPYSPTVTLSPQRSEVAVGGGTAGSGSRASTESNRARRSLTDEQCAFLLLMVFAIIAILIAFVIQYFVIK
uniref:Fibronectin type-III domain-containing protein n=1 Tax=Echeneis naucrates TaxID=173247 RepID=A0A665UIW8_ECHNA